MLKTHSIKNILILEDVKFVRGFHVLIWAVIITTEAEIEAFTVYYCNYWEAQYTWRQIAMAP